MREGWEYKKLGEISFYPNNRILKTEITPTNYVGVEQLLKDREGVSFEKETPSVDSATEYVNNDILIGNIRPYLRKIWLSDRRGGASGDVVVIRISPSFIHKIQASYLYKVLSSEQFFNYDNANTKGAKMPRGDRNAIAKYPVPIPPLPEQQHIVSELDLLSSLIDKQKAQLKELDKLAHSIFYDMFGDPVENEKGWEVKKLGDISENFDSYRKPITSSNRISGDVPYYGASGIVDYVRDYIFDDKYLLISEDGANLMARSTPIAFSIEGKTWVNNHAHILKFEDLSTQLFVEYNINLRDISNYLTGSVQPKLNQAKLNIIPIPLPPLPLQHLFAEKIQAIESQKASITQSIAETQKLFDYTMDKYFG